MVTFLIVWTPDNYTGDNANIPSRRHLFRDRIRSWVRGPVRIFFIVPRFGDRTAELLEAPIMLAVIILAARWVIQYLSVPSSFSNRLGMGLLGLGLMDEGTWMRGRS